MTGHIEAGSTVRHPLYPELGVGRVLEIARSIPPAARVEWSEVGQTSTHALSVLRGAPAVRDVREALAHTTRACGGAARWGLLSTHDHTHCLLEADHLITQLAQAGYRVIGLTDLATVEAAAGGS